ncbi:SacI homology domain containing protein [Trichomonas vaginalis G3]|uniref:SacI homology domain containing protein n=1 Tax=Trichomonas vaginalis (strain ATCC PRA-98 / G3) TaxID=412133 RepID=A2F3N2_TRIV3|nr:phosphoinositide phosphatase SAC9-related family [Trichomonas vaginalis G3]EAY00500.1 SacI homology domain containing protein [Trichomonas vaginalis G3]KAI5520542.1 phosphoinositide phosphatase SAC9-related family [Trichomonas vaginalis G3]|eukprot:XP_001313429.1 SacI homology domain containing protein [Trichomonas vaginalis G3]
MTIHPLADIPSYLGIPNIDVFQNFSEAMKNITTIFKSKIIADGIALVGMVKEEDQIIFSIIKEQTYQCDLPGKIPINVVKTAQFISIIGNKFSYETQFNEFPLEDCHYYAEFFDITRPFPSQINYLEPDPEFCWNMRWREPFVRAGVPEACIILIQGYVSTQILSGHSISFLIKRSALNPGVRYFARGLNEVHEPGNECECEFIFGSPTGDIWTQIYRRGSVPIKWETVVKNKMTVHHIVTDQSSEGSKCYFRKLKERYCGIQTFCISLLRSNPESGEYELHEAFSKVVKKLNNENSARFISFDLNYFLDNGGHTRAIAELCKLLGPLAQASDFTHYPNALDSSGNLNKNIEPDTRQVITLRFNCADSLDRTNVAAFIYSCAITTFLMQKQNLIQNLDTFSFESLQKIKPEVIEYLAEAYVKSGDVVSLLYTNTVAAKTSIIRQYSPFLDEASSDATISVKRRFNNMVSDPQREVLFEKWTNYDKNEIGDKFVLDHTKIQILSRGFPIDVLILNENDIVDTTMNSFSIILPYSTKLTAIYYYATVNSEKNHPRNLFIQGQDKSQMKTVKLPMTNENTVIRIPIDEIDDRNLDFIFHPQIQKISVGKILFEVKKVQDFYQYQVDFSQQNKENFNLYKDFIVTTMQEIAFPTRQFQDIELQRLKMNLSREFDMNIKLSIPLDPYKLSQYNSSTCYLCGNKNASNIFCFSELIKNRITKVTNQKSDNLIHICDECLEMANMLCIQTEMMESTRFTKIHLKESKKRKITFSMPIVVTENPESFIIGAPQELLENTCAKEVSKEFRFTVVLSHYCELEHFEFYVSKFSQNMSITIIVDEKLIPLVIYEKDPGVIWAGIQKVVVTDICDIIFRTNEKFVLSGFQIHGIPTNKMELKTSSNEVVEEKVMKKSSSLNFNVNIYSKLENSDKFTNPEKIMLNSKKFGVLVSVNRKSNRNNLVFGFYKEDDSEITFCELFTGEMLEERKLVYLVDAPEGTKYARAFCSENVSIESICFI